MPGSSADVSTKLPIATTKSRSRSMRGEAIAVCWMDAIFLFLSFPPDEFQMIETSILANSIPSRRLSRLSINVRPDPKLFETVEVQLRLIFTETRKVLSRQPALRFAFRDREFHKMDKSQ